MNRNRIGVCGLTALLAVLIVAPVAHAQWRATVGAESDDLGRQALAFLPNEIWIHAGDSVTWTLDTEEIHTVTFLRTKPTAQIRPFFPFGCPGFSPSGSIFDGLKCVTTPPLVKGQTFTVTFPSPGNFQLVCLVHENMTAAVHVLASSQPLPHDQAFYDNQADNQRSELLAEVDLGSHAHSKNEVTVGSGKILSTAGGSRTVSMLRFMDDEIIIHKGETVEWVDEDPVTPHTITFGKEPKDPFPPSANVTMDADGALHAVVSSLSDNVHSGFVVAAPQERLGLAQSPLPVTRFRVTFPNAGTFPYICALHDDLGMKGEVVVEP